MFQQKVPASQQVQQLTAQLNQALLEQHALDERQKVLAETIRAIRNTLAGVGLGQQLQQEIAAEKAPAAQ
jgi:hypothetical protein